MQDGLGLGLNGVCTRLTVSALRRFVQEAAETIGNPQKPARRRAVRGSERLHWMRPARSSCTMEQNALRSYLPRAPFAGSSTNRVTLTRCCCRNLVKLHTNIDIHAAQRAPPIPGSWPGLHEVERSCPTTCLHMAESTAFPMKLHVIKCNSSLRNLHPLISAGLAAAIVFLRSPTS
jgi:hypothetical protein